MPFLRRPSYCLSFLTLEPWSLVIGFTSGRAGSGDLLTLGEVKNTCYETLTGDPGLDLPEFDRPPADPLRLLGRWLETADEHGVREPRALALATADAEGRPSTRIVLLKQVLPAVVFAFSSGSRKGRELAVNPQAAGTLYWRETLQQIVFEGPVAKMTAAESDALFAERPPAGQAAAIASSQGEPLQDPERLRAEA